MRYNSNESKERVVVEQLMRGPSNNRLLATIPKGTKLLGVSIKDHICYLNFDEGLRNIAPGVSPETVIYSIVNSVIDGGNVSEVQISINGDSSIVYQESIKLDEPLSRNQERLRRIDRLIKRRLGFAGILLAGLILVLYLTGGGKDFWKTRCVKV